MHKKRYAKGGAIKTPGSNFSVKTPFLRGLLSKAGIDSTMLDKLNQQALGNRLGGPDPGKFGRPVAVMAKQAEKAEPAPMAAKNGGLMKKRKYI